MGVPGFYRWLVEKYPLTVMGAVEEGPIVIDDVKIEYDNLYLDMNYIIHRCYRLEDCPPPSSYEYDQVFQRIYDYIDRLFLIVRPKKLLFMAMDGFAPKAKTNQQRLRRSRAAKNVADVMTRKTKLQECEKGGREPTVRLASYPTVRLGTEFMDAFTNALESYIDAKQKYDDEWKKIEVRLSHSKIHGEGEQKIMFDIRRQRGLPGYNPYSRHCLYGMDADLIMLALASHDVQISILREFVFTPEQQHNLNRKAEEFGEKGEAQVKARQPCQFLHVWKLREHLISDTRIENPPIQIDFDRIVDDFIFMCLFVGNDFLPCMPTLDVRWGGIDLLLAVYKKEFRALGGYLTDSSKINLNRVEHFIQVVGSYEDCIFQERARLNQREAERIKPGEDKVRFGEGGWKKRYYEQNLSAKTPEEHHRMRKDMVAKYIEGLAWVMQYYYGRFCSWDWFYPYHSAPLASDLFPLKPQRECSWQWFSQGKELSYICNNIVQ